MEILELLEAKGIHYIMRSKDEASIVCPNEGQHSLGRDSNPSFSINLERHVSNCLACGFSLKGEALLTWLTGGALEELEFRTMAIKAKIKQINHTADQPLSEARQVFIPPGEPWSDDGFRGISLETYTKLGAIRCDRGFYSDRLVFPIYLGGELQGVDARALKGQQPKYLRNKGCTCSTDWLYPYDIVKEMKPTYVILGEGIFHSINGIDKGFPTLNFFGVQNFSRTKLRMILSLGVDYVVYFKDNDKAGMKAELEIGSLINDWLPVYSADTSKVPEGKDLGDLTTEEIQYALDNKSRLRVPQCLPDGRPNLLGKCRHTRCPFNDMGKCQNFVW